MALASGTRLGPYEIRSALGAGAMGEVYRAFDTTLQRTVAIKILATSDDEAGARLLEEARAASALNHPHVCTVHEVGGRPCSLNPHTPPQAGKRRHTVPCGARV